MRKILALAKTLRKGSGEKGSGSADTVILVFGIIMAVLLAALGVFLNRIPNVIPDPNALFLSLFFLGAVMGLVFTVPLIVNTMYMSNDLPVLLTLPYTYHEIICAKVLNVSSVVWLSSAVCSLPCGVAYGIANGSPVSFFLALVLATVCIPVIMLSFAGSLCILLMSFVKIFRNKDVIKVLGAVLGFVLIVGMVIASNLSKVGDDAMAGKILTSVSRFSGVLPISFALRALLAGSLNPLMLLAAVGITAAFFLVFVLLARFLYITGALAMQETSMSGMSLQGAAFQKACRQRSVFRAYFKKDLWQVSRNPAYLMHGFLFTYLYPVVILAIYIFSTNSFSFLALDSIKTNLDVLGWTTCVAMLVSVFSASANAIATSCMSREGEDIMLLKQTPVDYRTVLRAKQYVTFLICGGSCLLYTVVGGGVMVALKKLPVWSIPYAAVLSIGLMVFCVNTVMLRDVKKPNFVWESEADMLKNRNGAASVILLFAGLFLALAIAMLLKFLPDVFFWPILAGLLVLTWLLALLSAKRLYRIGLEKMARY